MPLSEVRIERLDETGIQDVLQEKETVAPERRRALGDQLLALHPAESIRRRFVRHLLLSAAERCANAWDE